MGFGVLAKDRFEATRSAVKRLDAVNLAILLEGEDWKPPSVRVRAGISDPTGKAGIYRAEELPEVMKRLRDEKAELESYIGTSLRLIENVRKGLGIHYGNILEWIYVDLESWDRIRDLYGVPKSTGCERRNIAFDWVDSIGLNNVLKGEYEL